MFGVIYDSGTPGAGAWDIAGKPLLMRQLQWLRDNGIGNVIVEVCAGGDAARLADWLFGSDPLLTDVTVLPSASPLGLRALAERAGLGDDELVMALPSDLFVQCKLPSPARAVRYQLAPPAGFVGARVEIAMERLDQAREPAESQTGWALRVASVQDAVKLSWAVLTGAAPGVLLHASESRPGVWLGRGAHIASSAQLRPPVLVGAFARVGAQTELGPRAIVGAHAVIGEGAQLIEAVVTDFTLVGDGTRARGSLLCEEHVIDLRDGMDKRVHDPLELTSLRAHRHPNALSRLAALLIVALLAMPWSVAALALAAFRPIVKRHAPHPLHTGGMGLPLLDLVPRLYDVVLGHRTLIGPADVELLDALPVGGSPCPGALDIAHTLCANVSKVDASRLLRWYALNKAARVDWRLLLRLRS